MCYCTFNINKLFIFKINLINIFKCFLMYVSPVVHVTSQGIDKASSNKLSNVLEDYSILNRPQSVKETYYDPYWDAGHWVFNRYKLKSTQMPMGHILQKGNSTKHHDCNQICLGIYETYGEICAQRFITPDRHWRYEYTKFHNMCYLEYENCKHLKKHWYPIHRGNCPEFMTMTRNPTNPSKAVKRMKKWQKRIKENLIGVGLVELTTPKMTKSSRDVR